MRNGILTIVVFLLLNGFSLNAQTWDWAEHAGGILPDEANGCYQDEAGNIYMSGFYFSTDINFGNGNQLSNDGLSDGFIVKYNANGNTQWASKVKGPNEDKATKCTADRFGNVYTTGYFDSPSIQFGGNNNDNVSNSDNSGGTFDAFIVKYNSSGSPQWYHSIGEDDDDGGSAVAADTLGNVYVTGWFRAPSVQVSSSVTIYNTSTGGGPSDMFLIKYDQNGEVLWAKGAGGPDDDKGRGVTVDNEGNVVVTGYCKPPSMTIEGTLFPNNGSKDFFLIKYDANGNLLNAKTYGGSGGEEAFSCSTDSDGNVFVSGNCSSTPLMIDTVTLVNNGSGSGAFLLKLDPTLNALWAKSISSDSNDEARGCYADRFGNSVVTGVFTGNSLTVGNNVFNNNGGEEIFLAKYDSDGNLFWAKKVGKSNDDGSNDCHILDNGRALIAGYFNSGSLTLGTIDFDNSYFGVATSDVFIAHTCEASTGVQTVEACNAYAWIDGNTYTTSSNVDYSFSNGGVLCDSIVTLNLTLNSVDVTVTETSPTLTANSGGLNYRWLDCDDNYSFVSGEDGQSFTAITNGNYAVEVTDNGCVDTSDCVLINSIPVGVSEHDLAEFISAYPNPTNHRVVIEFEQDFSGTIRIIDALGRSVSVATIQSRKQIGCVLPKQDGVYLLQLVADSGKVNNLKVVRK